MTRNLTTWLHWERFDREIEVQLIIFKVEILTSERVLE